MDFVTRTETLQAPQLPGAPPPRGRGQDVLSQRRQADPLKGLEGPVWERRLRWELTVFQEVTHCPQVPGVRPQSSEVVTEDPADRPVPTENKGELPKP